jgi:hypothetical protein
MLSSSCNVPHTRVRETPRRVESSRATSKATLYISRMFSCSSVICLQAPSDETRALGSVSHSRNVWNTLENTPRFGILRRGNPQRYSSTAAVALPSPKLQTYSTPAYSAFVTMCGVFHNSQQWRSTTGGKDNTVRPSQTTVQSNGLYLGNRSE